MQPSPLMFPSSLSCGKNQAAAGSKGAGGKVRKGLAKHDGVSIFYLDPHYECRGGYVAFPISPFVVVLSTARAPTRGPWPRQLVVLPRPVRGATKAARRGP
jgi:hypothetical protein